jgi:hypothetical protein
MNDFVDTQKDVQNANSRNCSSKIAIQEKIFKERNKKKEIILLPNLRQPPGSDEQKDSNLQTVEDINVERQPL